MSGWLAFWLIYAWAAVTVYSSGPPTVSPALRVLLGLLWPIVIFFLPRHRSKVDAAKRDRQAQEAEAAWVQARKDQTTADYPGCELGLMQCRSQTCGCNASTPSRAFLVARVKRITAKQGG